MFATRRDVHLFTSSQGAPVRAHLKRVRTFLALMLDANAALALDHWRAHHWPMAGRDVLVQNLHVTLCFLGDVDEHRLQRVGEYLDEALATPLALDVVFDEPGWQANSGIAWLACTKPPAALLALGKRMRGIAGRAGIRVDKRAFVPHVTLTRRVEHPPPAPLTTPSIGCRFELVSLVESLLDERGMRYRELATWPVTDSVDSAP